MIAEYESYDGLGLAELVAKREVKPEELLDAELRAEVNLKDDRVGYKIREASLQRIPYVIVVGERETEHHTVNPRERDAGELGEMSVADFLERVASERRTL